MIEPEFRIIPGYNCYGVTCDGCIKSLVRNQILSTYWFNEYLIVDTFRDSLTETLPVHRAVALAWVINPDPLNFTVVNHLDGIKSNNHFSNLEWTNYSGNNYHAINTGLRNDNLPCKIRDFYTKEIYHFSSVAQATEFMGLGKSIPNERLCLKKFGSLIADRYEFKYSNDNSEWFYENRNDLINPSRFMVTVVDDYLNYREVYSNKALLQDYYLYDCPLRSINALAEHGNKKYPDLHFTVRDSYSEKQHTEQRKTNKSFVTPVRAIHGSGVMEFKSLTECAETFGVDRSSITSRISNGKDLDGWIFMKSLD